MLSEHAPEPQTKPSESRRLDIQGLRAVAVILVVAFHSGLPVPGGFIGVDVFLVISGFVITGMLMRELQKTGTIRFRNFYSRRIKRLLPALALLTTVVVVLSIFFGSSFGSQQTTAKTGLGATYISANMVIYNDSIGYFSPEAETNPLLHTWTLSVEEQVYLIFPTLLLGSWLFGSRLAGASRGVRRSARLSRRSSLMMLALIAAVSFVFCLLVSYGKLSTPPAFAFFSSLTRVWEFALGAALAFSAHRLSSIAQRTAGILGLVGAVAILIGAFTITGEMVYPGIAVLVPVLGAAAVIIAGFRPSRGVPAALSTKPMTWIGDVSYSWYLWHWPLIVFGAIIWPESRAVLALLGIASLIPAWLSTTLLENPIRKNPAIKGRRVVALAAVCTVIPTLACVGLAAGANSSWGNEAVAEMQSQVGAEHAAETNDCADAATEGTSINDPECSFNASSKGPHAYLVGNSVAAMYSEALIGASENLDIPLTIDTAHGCFSVGGADQRDCSDNFTNTVNKLIQRPPGIVVMSSTWDLGAYGGDQETRDQTIKETTDALISSLTEAITKLNEAGHHVVMVLPTPRFFHGSTEGTYVAAPDPSLPRSEAHASLWRPQDCPAVIAENNTADCGATVPEAEEAAAQQTTMEALAQIAADTGATTLNLRSRYCIDGVCRTNVGDRWMYEDGIHIGVDESESLAPVFTRLLDKVIRKSWGPTPGDQSSPTP